MKRAVICGTGLAADAALLNLARESAVSLLTRSISFGHRRLAVIRLETAVNTGAEVSKEVWDYCRNAALQSRDIKLLGIYSATERKRGAVTPVGKEPH